MEIRLPPDQEARLAAIAASAGRSTAEVVQEAVALWEERENARVLAEFRASLDEAEASIARGEGIEINRESMRSLAEDVKQRGRARIAAEKQPPR
jgi:predicted transcriptional regulator